MKKNVIAGLGEIGYPLFQIISKFEPTIGYDLNPKLQSKTRSKRYSLLPTSLLHIAIPFSKEFDKNIMLLVKKFLPQIIVIHSTVSPNTTKQLQSKLSIPIIYSPIRGVHKRMLFDLKRYTKFYSIESTAPRSKWASFKYSRFLKKCNIKSKKISRPITLELAKIIVDTTYYGWLITYAQLSNMIARKHNVDYDEMWLFADEIHKFIGNRPKMFPGFIGGHCIIHNLGLIDEESLWQIDRINNIFSKTLETQN